MKMFKKIMAVALTAVMAVSVLTGCAVSDKLVENQIKKALENITSSGEKETTFTSVSGEGNTKEYRAAYDAVLKALKQEVASNKTAGKSDKTAYKAPDETMLSTAVTEAGDAATGYTFVVAKYSTSKDTVMKSMINKDALKTAVPAGTKANFYTDGHFEACEKDGNEKTCDWSLVVVKAK